MIVGVEPDRRRRESVAADEGELDRRWALRSGDLDRLPNGKPGVAAGQQVDAFVAGGYERLDILLAGEPRTAIGIVTLGPIGRRSGID